MRAHGIANWPRLVPRGQRRRAIVVLGVISAAAGLYFTFGEIGCFCGPFLIGVLSGALGVFAVPLVVLAALQVAIAVSALFLREGSDGRRLAAPSP